MIADRVGANASTEMVLEDPGSFGALRNSMYDLPRLRSDQALSDSAPTTDAAEASLSGILARRESSGTGVAIRTIDRELDDIRIFASGDLDPRVEAWLLSSGLSSVVAQVVFKIAQFLDGATVRLEVGRHDPSRSSLIVWIDHPGFAETPEVLLDRLDAFDERWWLSQPERVRTLITILLA